MQLSAAEKGITVKIDHLDSGRELTARMAAMGLIPGTELKIISNDMRGPIIIEVKSSRIALGRGMAEQIYVETVHG